MTADGDVHDHRAGPAGQAPGLGELETGGIGVLAHPDKYRMTRRKLECLAGDFAAAGGRCIEIVCGRVTPAVTAGLAELAGQFGFSVSLGSDFHAPTPWSRPGVETAIVGQCTPVWDAW